MHTAVVADELARRGHQVVLFAKEGSRSRARVRAVLESSFRYGLMPDAAGVDRSDALCDQATALAASMISRWLAAPLYHRLAMAQLQRLPAPADKNAGPRAD